MKQLQYYALSFGCDPELFISKDGKIIGSEKVIPEEGITRTNNTERDFGRIVRDGVQVELNPEPNSCRENLAGNIRECFVKLSEELKSKNVEINFSLMVDVTPEEMKNLGKQSRIFGCDPSKNLYTGKVSEIKVDPNVYLKRTAGGHIHIGYYPDDSRREVIEALKQPKRIVKMLDIIVGNTCVLIDRNPDNIERRKNYGRAGEYRIKSYGLEYRTPSNFWLQSYQLMSLVFGLVRIAVCIVINSLEDEEIEKAILDKVDMKDIEKAINENDYSLAYKNFNKIEKILCDITGKFQNNFPIQKNTMKEFKYFLKKGTGYWFKENPVKHWLSYGNTPRYGWELFLAVKVRRDKGFKSDDFGKKIYKLVFK